MPLLQVCRLSKWFGGLKALDQIDLHVEPNEILSIIGPNGSGKTTLFNLVSGIYQPDEGDILFNPSGRAPANIKKMKPHRVTAVGIARTFQNIRLFANMSVIENVMVGMHCRTRSGPLDAVLQTKRARAEEQNVVEEAKRLLAVFRSQLAPVMNEPAKAIPYAYQKRLEVVRALASRPKLVLLDEPSAGMNPHERREFIDDLKRLRDMGYTLMVIEHDMMMVKGLSDRVIAFDYGRKIAEGSFEEVRANELVIEAYLGKKHVSA
ncbi:MAG: ABC transporter ATP-binding protein [Candidatus Abyssobacteria bacterium SURF_5]|uniref:ABC transporter ATP-binding protein n=1 Tax=Abyssobacteria bacterium (strain SURF_5) TaxID=2093360 RepID=A0A3A4NFC0_ABYX5|nr:MAG: ABC transporter ATP-binding protein [Candidatus Abyssubacteria bacterium SURF_5]